MPLLIVKEEHSNSVIDDITKKDMMQGASTALQNCTYVVTWKDTGLADFSGSCIRARIYSNDGNPLTEQFTANSTLTNDQSNPAATTLADGRFVLTWETEDTGFLGSRQIRARIFNEDGTADGDDFLVNTYFGALGSGPDIAARPDGGFSIAWSSNEFGVGSDIATRNYSAEGSPLGPVYRVNATVIEYQFNGSITQLQSGNLLYTYTSEDLQPGPTDVRILGRMATAAGLAIGSEFIVAQGVAQDRGNSQAIALSNGGFLVTWDENSGSVDDPAGSDIRGQIFADNGNRIGNEFIVNSTTFSQQYNCKTVALSDGRFAAIYETLDAFGAGGQPAHINLRLFNADGSACGDDFRVSSTLWPHTDAELSVLGNGKLVVTFTSAQNPSFLGPNLPSSAVNSVLFDPNEFIGTDANDYWNAGGLNDVVRGGLGNDNLRGNDGDDTIVGGAGGDTLDGGANSAAGDTLSYVGSSLSVSVNLASGTTANGDAQCDMISGFENIMGSDFDDQLTGDVGSNVLKGEAGKDILDGGIGIDSLTGGDGDDTYVIDVPADTVTETNTSTATGGIDKVKFQGTSGTYTLTANVENLDLIGSSAINGTGNSLVNTITGNAATNILNGGLGADVMAGAGGSDLYYVDNALDVVNEAANGGTADRVLASVNYTLGVNQQIELFSTDNSTGTGAINLAGNNVANTILGNNGANVLNGGIGADRMTGLLGNDIYVVDNFNDVVIEAAGGGTADRVVTSANYVLAADQQIELFSTSNSSGTTAINLVGNNLANTILGNAGANIINGGLANDYLTGGLGADSFRFSTAITGGGNIDTITDFAHGTDKIQLAQSIFTNIGAGLNANEFKVGTAANTAFEHIVYNSATGGLFFDVDGVGGAAQVQFAKVTAGTVLDTGDFLMV